MIPDRMIPEQTSQPGLSIVIPSWNGRALLEKFLPTVVDAAAAVEAACRQPSEVVIADDASSDDTRVWLAAQFPHARFECSGERAGPVGFAPTANRGVRAARYALVYVVNNDVALDPTTLPPLAAHFVTPRVFAVASQVYDYDTGVLSGAGQLGEFRRGFDRSASTLVRAPSSDREVSRRAGLTLRRSGREHRLAGAAGWRAVAGASRVRRPGVSLPARPRSRSPLDRCKRLPDTSQAGTQRAWPPARASQDGANGQEGDCAHRSL